MNSEELLRQAVIQFHEAELKLLPINESLENEIEVSPEFELRMQQMIRKSRRHAVVNKIARRAAGFFIGIVAGIVFLCTVNENIRARCLQFLREIIDGMTQYSSTMETPNPVDEDIIGLQLGYVPAGFELTYSNLSEGMITYKLSDKEIYLDFDYDKTANANIRLYSEHSTVKKVILKDGSECDYYKGEREEDPDLLIWQIGQYACYLSITGDFDNINEELIKIAENVQIIK
ncbi:MAG: DUF4367 domain-containing protein [Lachnospiraceae bacterium]|nr:DUF4367 domain-containing protein [Lachnospiraceae bacterium]